MVGLLALLVLGAMYAAGILWWVVTFVRRQWRRPAWFMMIAVLLLPPFSLIFLWAMFAGSFDIGESCDQVGHTYDGAYAITHRHEFFPFHQPCDATYDLVAGWINPALALMFLLMAGSVVAAIMLTTRASEREKVAPRA